MQHESDVPQRELWATRIGLVLAMAGNAIGLGNFLRFPGLAASNGGGAFLIPYFIALVLLGIPMMWTEMAMGRYGGFFLHGTAPGVFNRINSHPISKYLGVGGLVCPFLVLIYYTYIGSWCFGYALHSLRGTLASPTVDTKQFFTTYVGASDWRTVWGAFWIYIVVLLMNTYILSRGIVRGIELLAKLAMPALFIFAIILVIRAIAIGTPDPLQPQNSISNGFGFIWNPDFSKLSDRGVWLSATGQIFFTLSIGFGVVLTYASYLGRKDDIALAGLSSAVMNEFAEVILGASIVIPVAVAFFGATQTVGIAKSGIFGLGFQTMPLIFRQLNFGYIFGALWFLLLFFAAITSSVALGQPIMAFMQDELHIPRPRAAVLLGIVAFLCGIPIIFLMRYSFLDQIDFWIGTVGIILFSLIEVIYFSWLLGMPRAWDEITRGAQLRVPRAFYWILKYVTPIYLIIILEEYIRTEGVKMLLMPGKSFEEKLTAWSARSLVAVVIVIFLLLIRYAWNIRKTRLDLPPAPEQLDEAGTRI